nr:hypothetical protein [Sinosporangium album]
MRAYSGPALGREAAVSGSLISKIEGGDRRCAPDLAARLDEILTTGGALTAVLNETPSPSSRSGKVDSAPANLDNRQIHGRSPTEPPYQLAKIGPGEPDDGGEGPVQRRTFMMLAAGTVAASQPATGLLDALAPSAPPARVTPEEIKQIVQAARMFGSADHPYGGALVREAVNAQLRWAVQLLDSGCPPKLRQPLFSAVGSLAATCGWMAFDSYAHDDARTMLELARSCAEEVGDWHLHAKVLSHLGRQAIWVGNPDTGLTFIELALVRSDRLTATEHAMLHTGRARALAKLVRLGDRGKIEETLRALGKADEAFSHSDPAIDPPWMGYYDAAQHHGDTGHALFDLVAAGIREPRAARRLATAVSGHTDQYARSRAISGTKLATLTMMTGDPAEGVTVARAALRDAAGIQSRRAFTDLRELARTAVPHQREHGVPELCARIRKMVPDQ